MLQTDTLRKINDEWLSRRLTAATGHSILIADDSESDIYFLFRALESSGVKNPVYLTRTGEQTLQFLKGIPPFPRSAFPRPNIIFLDLLMPGVNGFDILRWKSTCHDYDRALFIALSNSNRTKHISEAYDYGANTFLSKPLEGQQVSNLIEAYRSYWDIVGSGKSKSAT